MSKYIDYKLILKLAVLLILALLFILGKNYFSEVAKVPSIRIHLINIAKVAIPLKNLILMRDIDDKIALLKSSGSCVFCDLTQGNFKGSDLKGVDLRYAILIEADLSNTNLSRANLSNVNLSRADLSNTNLSRADLFRTNLQDANLQDANLNNARLYTTNFTRSNLAGIDLTSRDLLDANLSEVDISETALIHTDLSGVNLSGVDLSNKDLTGVNLSGVDLSNKDLTGTILTQANLSGANLDGVDLSNKDLTGVNLSGVDLSNKDLTGTILTQANLSGANLDGVDLRNKDLTGVNLSGIDLSNKDLTGTIAEGAKKIQINFQNISESKWPSFFEMKDLGIKGNVGKFDDISYLQGEYYNVSNFDLSENLQYLTTKEGFLYELMNEDSKLVLNLNKDAQFPFTDVGYNAGLLDVASNKEFVYISYTSKGPDFDNDFTSLKRLDVDGFSSLIVDEYSHDFKNVRNIIKIDGFLPTHYGGALEFDNQGRLYLSTGDGGPHPRDANNHAQNLKDLRGKILRLDISELKLEPEIVAFGIRNPFGVIIDSKDRMFINSCGSDTVETVYLLKDLNSDMPYNLGWPVFSGTMRMRPNDPLILKDILTPIYEYKIRPGCATGGVVLDYSKGIKSDKDELYYLFADFYGTLRIIQEQKNGEWQLMHEHKQNRYVIYNLGYDKKTKKIILAPHIIELEVLADQVKLNQ